MALTFGAATSDRCDIGSASALDDMTTGTAWLWTRITTLTAPRCFFGKNASLALNVANPSAQNIRLIRATTGTNIIYTTSDNPLSTNAWLFIAATWDFNASSGRAKIYTGTLTALATERTYGTAQDGSGSLQTDAAAPFHWGNNGVSPTPAQALQGSIARCGLANRVLSLEEIRQLQRGPRPVAGLLGMWELGFDGTGTQIDRGGGGFNGTVTGASLGNHVPLRRWRRGRVPLPYAPPPSSITGNGTLGLTIGLAGTGTVAVQGAGTLALSVGLTGTGTVPRTGAGTLALTLGLAGTGAVGSTPITGDGTLALAVALTGAGVVPVQGAGTLALAIALAGDGVIGTPPVVGDGTLALAVALSGTGTVAVRGAGTLALTLGLTGAGTVPRTGAGTLALAVLLGGGGTVTTGLPYAGMVRLSAARGARFAVYAGTGPALRLTAREPETLS